MSTLATTNIKHPSSASNNIVLDSAGGVDLDALTVSGSAPADSVNIDASGRLLVGTSSAPNLNIAAAPRYSKSLIYNTADNDDRYSLALYTGTTGVEGPQLLLVKNKANSTTGTLVANGDEAGMIAFAACDGAAPGAIIAARITAFVDGTPGANDMPGRLVFSTTADGAASPTERLRIRENGQLNYNFASNDAFRLVNSTSGSKTGVIQIYNSGAFNDFSSLVFNVNTTGNVTNLNNSYGSISDIKLKENIVDASSQWSDIKTLQVRKYNLKEGQTHTQIGLVAQEVELVSPGLVSESPDRDAEGNDLGTVTKSVNYSVLYMKSVKALQEAMERIETLEASNTDLLARVSALEST